MFVLVEAADWPFSTAPCTPMLEGLSNTADWSQLGGAGVARPCCCPPSNDLGICTGQMAPMWRHQAIVMMNPAVALSGSDTEGSDTEDVAGTSPPVVD
ncbi:hypothetical protein Dimus_030614 [Dionaea muscipula]